MNKLQEILKSGVAPGFIGNATNPCAESAKRGLKAVEDEPIFKHGPSRGASRIAKYMGFSTDFIKKTWDKPVKRRIALPISLLGAFLLLGSIRTAEGQYITPGVSLQNGDTVYASTLNQLVANAIIGPGFISTQPINANPQASDYLLEYSPSLNGLYKFTFASIYGSPQAYLSLPQGTPNSQTNDLFSFYSQSNSEVMTVTFPSLLTDIQEAVTTNSVPFLYDFTFYPWLIYGTNTIPPYTNAWGLTTNFPITSFYMTNQQGSNIQALLPTDTIPINSGQEGTNTAVSLKAIFQSVTNQAGSLLYPTNLLLAKVSFSGISAQFSITNISTSTGIITNVALAVNFTNPTPISVNATNNSTLTTPSLMTNTVYWAQVTNESVLSFQLFTTLTNAQTRLNPILGNGANINNSIASYYVTNYSSFNCAAVQCAYGTAGQASGQFIISFLNPSLTPYYYITGSCSPAAAPSLYGTVVQGFLYPQTNYCQIATVDLPTGSPATAVEQMSLVGVTIQTP